MRQTRRELAILPFYEISSRILRRSILDSERADVRVHGKKGLDSLVLLVPLDDAKHDIERQLALFLMRLNTAWRSRHMELKESAEFLEKLPNSLREMVINYGMRRKNTASKKSVLYCLSGLIAENVYKYRHQHENLLGPYAVRCLLSAMLEGLRDEDIPSTVMFNQTGKTIEIAKNRSTSDRKFLRQLHTIQTFTGVKAHKNRCQTVSQTCITLMCFLGEHNKMSNT